MLWNPAIETMSRTDMEQLQLERLRATIEQAYARVPLYRRRMDEQGLKPDDVRSLQDLSRLPFMTKKDLRDHYPFGLFAEPLSSVVRIHASSGTRGKPTVVGYTRNDLEVWAEVVARCFCMAGGEPGHVFHNAYGYGLFTGGLGLHYGVELAGGLVFTSLTKEAFPVIRYRTGDIGALFPEPCSCGRTLTRMSRVKGRVDDMLIVRGINVFPSEVEYQLLQLPELAPHYQIVVNRSGSLDEMEIVTEPAEAVVQSWGGFDLASPAVQDLQARVSEHLTGALGVRVRVTLVPPETVPRSEGKAVRVVDHRQVLA